MSSTGKFLYICLTISSCYGSIPLAWGLKVRDGGLSNLCHSWGLICQQRVLKMFPSPGYLFSQYGVVCLWHPYVNLYIWLTISSCYGSIRLGLCLILRNGGLSTPCQSCGFGCHQRVLKTFLGSGYLLSEDGVVWVWHPLVNLHIWLKNFILLRLNLFGLRVDSGRWWFAHSMP